MKQSLNEVMPKKYEIVDDATGIVIVDSNDFTIITNLLEKIKMSGKSVTLRTN